MFYFANIYYLYWLSVIPLDKILVMAGRQTRKNQQQISDLLSEEKENDRNSCLAIIKL